MSDPLIISDKSIFLKAVFPCPVSQMWQLWTTREGLLRFFGRDNNVELAPGGAFEIYFLMENPPGLRGSEGCKVLSFLPGKMLSFSWNAPPHIPFVRNHPYKTWVVVTFEEAIKNKTAVAIHHLGWPEGEEWNKAYEYFSKAWEEIMNNLAEFFSREE